MSDAVTLDAVSKKPVKTVPVHARIPTSDVAEVDRIAAEQHIPISRSHMIALIVSEWVAAKRSLSRPGIPSPREAVRTNADQGAAKVKRRLSPKQKR